MVSTIFVEKTERHGIHRLWYSTVDSISFFVLNPVPVEQYFCVFFGQCVTSDHDSASY